MTDKNIVLVGMMGSGKTTVAKFLSNILKDFTLVDLDDLIEKNEECKITEIFAQKGEKYFRQQETQTIKKIKNGLKQIISTGGGICEKQENLDLLKENGIIFYLKTDENELYQRIKNDKTRPLLNNTDIKTKIKELLKQRESNYRKTHITIDTNKKSPPEIAQLIIEEYKNYD